MAATAEDLTRAIGQAKKDGDLELAKKLEKRLDALLDTPAAPAAAEQGSAGWIDEVEGLGSVKVDVGELPKRSAREVQAADAYFNGGAKQYAEDEARLNDLMGGFDNDIEEFPG